MYNENNLLLVGTIRRHGPRFITGQEDRAQDVKRLIYTAMCMYIRHIGFIPYIAFINAFIGIMAMCSVRKGFYFDSKT